MARQQPGYLGHESARGEDLEHHGLLLGRPRRRCRLEAGRRAPRRPGARPGDVVRRLHRPGRDGRPRLLLAMTRARRTAGDAAGARRGPADRDRTPPAARRTQGAVRRAATSTTPGCPSSRRARSWSSFALGAETDAEWASFVRRYRKEMSTPAARHLLDLLAAWSQHLVVLSRLLLRGRDALPPLGPARPAGRARRRPGLRGTVSRDRTPARQQRPAPTRWSSSERSE